MLPEERRKQLDGIVSKMVANGEQSNTIDFVVNDFKSKYSVQEPQKSFLEKTAGVLDAVFGGGKIGEAIGTKIAEISPAGKKLKEQENVGLVPKGTTASAFKQPSAGEIAGSALQSAALFIPGGKLASVGTKLATKAGVKVGASALGKIGTGIGAGAVFDVASNLQQGKTGAEALTPGLGATIGGFIPAVGVGKNVMVRFGEKQAPRIINSLIKPLAKDFSYGKNPGRAIAEEGIVANNFDDLIDKIRTTRQSVGERIGQLGDNLSQQPVLQLQNSLSPLDEAIKTAASQNNTSVLQRLNNVKRALTEVLEPQVDSSGNIGVVSIGSKDLNNLTFKQARTLLGDIGDLTSFTGNPSDDKAVNAALKRVYGNIKGETLKFARQIDPVTAREFEKLTEKYADLSSAEIAAKYRDKIVQRQNLVGLSPQTVGIGTGLITAVATGGATLPAVLAGLSGAMIDKLASTPGFKTRLAYLLSTKSQREVNFLFRKIPALKEFFTFKKGVTPGDVVLNKVEQTPNKQGGFIKVSTTKSSPQSSETYYRGEGGNNVAQGKALLAEGKHFAMDAEYPKGFGNVTEYTLKPDRKVLDLGDSTFAEISQKLGIPERKYISPKELSKIAKEKGHDVLKYRGEYKSSGKPFVHTVELSEGSFVPKVSQSSLLTEAKKVDIITDKPIKVYRGEGKGIGNTTFVRGQYFADSKKFAETFGKVTESEIPAGSKIFNFDAVKNTNKLPKELLVDSETLTKYLVDNGYDYTVNTNSRGVEYVKLNKAYNELLDMALTSKDQVSFTRKFLENYEKYRDEINRVYTPRADESVAGFFWRKSRAVNKKLLKGIK